jgi:hypothetical protein
LKELLVKKTKDQCQMLSLEGLNTLNIYTITQYQLSQHSKTFINNPTIKMEVSDISKTDIDEQIYEKWKSFDRPLDKLLTSEKIDDSILPKVTLITKFTNQETFYHMLLTFMKLNYPRHLLELIIVDETGSENKMNLPEDKRIRLINLNSKGEILPIGYVLNIGVKYASGEVIAHFFDTNIYQADKFKALVIHLIVSNKDCVISKNSGVYPDTEFSFPDLANFMYTKSFWNKYSFEESPETNYTDVIYSFLKYRTNCISFIPFIFMSFSLYPKLIKLDTINNHKKLPFDLKYTITDSILQESVNILTKG